MRTWDSMKNKIGNPYQIAGTRHYMLTDGGASGTRAIDVKTGSGFEYTVLPDRGMDISLASYKGVNLVYLGPMGEMNPAFYNCTGNEWLRTFFGGLLTTCGPGNIGPACVDDAETLGLHGRFNCTPCRNVCDLSDIERGEIRITGEIVNAVLFGAHLRVYRTITSVIWENKVCVEDVIQNDTGHSVSFAMLYHINFGYPLLDDCAEINVNSTLVEPRDGYSEQYMGELKCFSAPNAQNKEKNFLHSFDRDTETGRAQVYNPKLRLGAEVKFDTEKLAYLSHWKMEGVKDYVLALEPCNAPCEPRDVQREKGLLPFLEAGERVRHRVEIGIIE